MATVFDRGARADGPTAVFGTLATDPRFAGLTYEPFYGLREKPFSLTSDARFFYQSRSHAPAFDDLLNAIKRRENLTVLTGDIGTGKTTLCRAVLQGLDQKTFSAFVADPFASREDLLKVLLTDFGIASAADVTNGRLRDASRSELTYLLREFLDSLGPLQAFAVVFVDEAQNLSLPLLEELRILSDADGTMQVVLVGQLELDAKLRLPEMRQLDQRVSARCRLMPLDVAGVAGYISHRLHRAGGSADRISFSAGAVEAIYDQSAGVPRIINKLCDRALHAGYIRRAATIDRQMLDATTAPDRPVVRESEPAPHMTSAAQALTVPDDGDPVDAWLNGIDDPAVAVVAPAVDAQPTLERSAPRRSSTGRQFRVRVGYARRHHPRGTSAHIPRPWTHRLEVLAFSLVVLLFVLMVGPSLWDAGSAVWVSWMNP